MIIKFTNASGKANYGLVLARSEQNPDMVQVLWDRFTGLIDDLRSRGKLRDTDEAALGARISWVSTEPNPFVRAPTTTELLPIGTNVHWHNGDVATAHRMAQAGPEAFAGWLAGEWGRLSEKYLKRKYAEI